MTKVLLISTYELGHQPFGLASPAAWLQEAGADVSSLDLDVQQLDETLVSQAQLIALYLPMHTATRLAGGLIPRLKTLNPQAHLCCYGLYAPVNEDYLRHLGIDTILGGEFETGLQALYNRLQAADEKKEQPDEREASISLDRQQFLVPDRRDLPGLASYAHLRLPGGSTALVGYTEASRGCKHHCRHCPIVPVYNGRFRIVQQDVVLADIRQMVAAGAGHITFGDPDFFNGPGHAIPLIQALHAEFPQVTYDVTIKIEHLLKYDHHLPVLRDTGCLFITSAVESVDDRILVIMAKGHTRDDFVRAAGRLGELGLDLNPTFVTFTPWTTAEGYLDLLATVQELGLIGQIAPIQYAIRLLIPAGSRLLTLAEVRDLTGPFDEAALVYPWQHPDPSMDQLYREIYHLVHENLNAGLSREALFAKVWQTAGKYAPHHDPQIFQETPWDLAAKPVPRLSESWY